MPDSDLDLAERVARTETAEQVRTLLAAYGRACDGHNLDALQALFDPDIVISVPEQAWTGLDAVLGFFRDQWGASPNPSRHFITNIACDDLQPESARATSLFFYITAIDGRSSVGWGAYRDTFVRREGKLVFRTKHIDMDLLVDASDGWAHAMLQAAARV